MLFIIGMGYHASAQTKSTNTSSTSFQSSLIRGKVVYTQYCMPCHQVDGSGVMNMNPPLIKTTYVLGNQTELINILLKGMKKGVVIDDEEYSNPMPAVNFLSDLQVADVLTYVRNSFGNKGSVITPAQVKLVRAKK